jgi:hypothetical protein
MTQTTARLEHRHFELHAPRIGSLLVAGWLGAIITNLVLAGLAENEYWDIALRDFGLFLGAVALFLLAVKFAGRGAEPTRSYEHAAD